MFKAVSEFKLNCNEVLDLIENDVGCSIQIGHNVGNDGMTRGRVLALVEDDPIRHAELKSQTLKEYGRN